MFGKMKQFLGFVGIEVQLDAPTTIPKDVTTVEGKVRVIAKANQSISHVTVELTEHWEEGEVSQNNHQSRTYSLGKVEVSQAFDIQDGEFKEFPFTLSFQRRLSLTQQMSEKKGVLGALGKAAAFADNERSTYRINAVADVKGAALDPNAGHNIRFV